MENYKKLEEKIDALSKRNEWRIALASAIIAAIASSFAAYMAFVAEDKKVVSTQTIENEKNSIDVYKAFGDHIITGSTNQKCIALMLITTAHPSAGIKAKNQHLSSYLKCDTEPSNENQTEFRTFYESLEKNAGLSCGRTRVTFTTERMLSVDENSKANKICKTGIKIPQTFDGPWDDGSVSFYVSKSDSGKEIWCNCIPSD